PLRVVTPFKSSSGLVTVLLGRVPDPKDEAGLMNRSMVTWGADSEANVLAEWNALYDVHNEELSFMFEKQARVERFDLIQTFYAYKQEEVGLILNGLTKDFARFVRNYNMHNMRKTIGELHAMLIEYEKGLPNKAETPQRNCHVYLVELLRKRSKLALPVLQGIREARKLKQGALYLYVGNGVRAQVEAIGSFNLVFIGIYEIDMHDLVPNFNSIYNVSTKRSKHNLDSTYLWHCRLAHISKKRIEKLQKEGLLRSADDESFDQCVSCLSDKMTRKLFSHRPERATDLLRIIHTDVCGLLRHVSRQGASNFITFTDNCSRYGYIYLLKHKHEVFETFKVIKNEVENQLGKTIKALRSD
nr:retrotransposon protein, putative, Ty1-copia subclass [Tanacetum cinerariifolium]